MVESSYRRRLVSLDALRGFDMLFIIGLELVLRAVAGFLPEEAGRWLQLQMGHMAWEGLAVYDLIFPLFVFISGVAMHYSQARAMERGLSRCRIACKLWKRACVLVALGWLVNWDARWMSGDVRLASVLGLIGLSCAMAGSLALILRRRIPLVLSTVAILAGVYILQLVGGDMSPSGCVNAAIDAQFCPGRLHLGVLDPEGPLCIISATALCLCGMHAGAWLELGLPRGRAAAGLVGAGALALLAGCLSGPIIKNIWTPSFVLASAGVSSALLGIFHLVCDSAAGAKWSWPLRVVGVNALFIYLATHALPYGTIVQRLCGWALAALPAQLAPLGYSVCYLGVAWLLCVSRVARYLFAVAIIICICT